MQLSAMSLGCPLAIFQETFHHLKYLVLLARPKRFELLTPRCVVWALIAGNTIIGFFRLFEITSLSFRIAGDKNHQRVPTNVTKQFERPSIHRNGPHGDASSSLATRSPRCEERDCPPGTDHESGKRQAGILRSGRCGEQLCPCGRAHFPSPAPPYSIQRLRPFTHSSSPGPFERGLARAASPVPRGGNLFFLTTTRILPLLRFRLTKSSNAGFLGAQSTAMSRATSATRSS